MSDTQQHRKPREFYDHGFEDTGAPDTFYCGLCGMFMTADHFPGDPLDPMDESKH